MITKESTKEELIQWWLEALRSKQYNKGIAYLKRKVDNEYQYCCLGVIGEKICETHEIESCTENGGIVMMAQSEMGLTNELAQKIGLASSTGEFILGDDPKSEQVKALMRSCPPGWWVPRLEELGGYKRTSLARINDIGASFEIIAEIIALRPEGLFKDQGVLQLTANLRRKHNESSRKHPTNTGG